MRVVGAAAPCADMLAAEARDAVFAGRLVLLHSDGEDVCLLVSDPGDTPEDFARMVARVLELAA